MEVVQDQIDSIGLLLGISFPTAFKKSIANPDLSLPLEYQVLRPELTLDLDTLWGATEFLRLKRSDLGPNFAAIFLRGKNLICLDLKDENPEDAPVFEVDPFTSKPPQRLQDSFQKYLETLQIPAKQKEDRSHGADPWFLRGLSRLKWHMEHLPYQYDHKIGGKLPRSHLWRPYRFCVQDVLLGITVIRHDTRYNRLEADVFLTAQIPEYEADSGCRALALILLSDAYKSGGSMEIKFTDHVEGGRVPRELCNLALNLGVSLNHSEEGGITPKEAKALYLALSGLRPEVREKIMAMEAERRLSAASVCYAMHHGVWTAQELEAILFSSRFPDSILRGSLPPEAWHLFYYDLFHARNALMAGYLDRQLMKREHVLSKEENAIVELEDDERDVEIEFDSDSCAKIYRLSQGEKDVLIPWLYRMPEGLLLSPDQTFWVLLRGREPEDLQRSLDADLTQAIELKQRTGLQDIVCIMVPADFKRLETPDIAERAAEKGVSFVVCPEFVNQLDQEVNRRFELVRVMRQ